MDKCMASNLAHLRTSHWASGHDKDKYQTGMRYCSPMTTGSQQRKPPALFEAGLDESCLSTFSAIQHHLRVEIIRKIWGLDVEIGANVSGSIR